MNLILTKYLNLQVIFKKITLDFIKVVSFLVIMHAK